MALLYAQQQKSSFSPRSPRESYKLWETTRSWDLIRSQSGCYCSTYKGGSEHHSVSERRELNSAPTSLPWTIRKKDWWRSGVKKQEGKDVKSYFLSKTITRSTDHIRYHIIATNGARYAGRGFSNFPLIHRTKLSIHMKWGINLVSRLLNVSPRKILASSYFS